MLAGGREVSAADAIQGAATALKRIADLASTTNGVDGGEGPAGAWRTDAAKLAEAIRTMAAQDAAEAWLSLLDRLVGLSPSDLRLIRSQGDVPTQLLALALPPPQAWLSLREAIEKRPQPASLGDRRGYGLRFLASTLTGDYPAMVGLMEELEKKILEAEPATASGLLQPLGAIQDVVESQADDPGVILAALERRLRRVEGGGESWNRYGGLAIPDLVALVGEERATPILKRALVSSASRLVVEGAETLALARALVLACVDELKVPRWELAEGMEATALFEALDRKFRATNAPKPEDVADAIEALRNQREGDNRGRRLAESYYLMGLIARGRLDDATRFAETLVGGTGGAAMETTAVRALERAGYSNALDSFLYDLLKRNPKLPFWRVYLSVAAKTGNTDRMLDLARGVVSNQELGGALGRSIRGNLVLALLAADKVDEAVTELRALVADRGANPDAGSDADPFYSGDQGEQVDPRLLLARLGILLERPAWVTEGLEAMSRNPSETGNDYLDQELFRSRIAVLIEVGRFADAEEALVAVLGKAVRQSVETSPGGYSDPDRARDLLAMLVELYHRVGRHEDVLILLETSPDWGAGDLVSMVGPLGETARFSGAFLASGVGAQIGRNPFAAAAASALLRAGRREEARRVIAHMLDRYPDDDRAFELVVEMDGNDALPRLDELFARDPFQERPLIWKASLLFQMGRLEEAEAAARQAVRIDPSDGEQGKGDRMRVYAVLADIRAARGDMAEANLLRGAVQAIRLSERADDFHGAGLLTRAVAMYQESLEKFTDAYCVQSRLAVQLSDLGQHELAARHYEKAFELMPESFGRVESHCFGCERTFGAVPAQNAAEKVFSRLVLEKPNNPRVHYLLGYLRDQQGRSREAIPHFRRALELDPDYLNAWVRLGEISRSYRLRSEERDQIVFEILRLDPLRRHAWSDMERVRDLRGMWNALEAAHRRALPWPKELLALPASRAAMEKLAAAGSVGPFAANRWRGAPWRSFGDSEELSPGRWIARHALIRSIFTLLGPGGESYY